MQESILFSLTDTRHSLRVIWEKQLRSEPVRSPMANPDSLVYLMEWTLNEIFAEVRNGLDCLSAQVEPVSGPESYDHLCRCKGNPFLGYFGAARKAVIVWTDSGKSPLVGLAIEERARCVQELLSALEAVARREIESFCSLCRYQNIAPLQTGQEGASCPSPPRCTEAIACRR